MKVKSESEVAQSCPTLATPWTAAYRALEMTKSVVNGSPSCVTLRTYKNKIFYLENIFSIVIWISLSGIGKGELALRVKESSGCTMVTF